MDQSTLPTRQSVRIKLQRITPVRRREIEERGKWSIFTSLDLLPQPKRRRVRRHDNDDALNGGDNDDVLVGELADALAANIDCLLPLDGIVVLVFPFIGRNSSSLITSSLEGGRSDASTFRLQLRSIFTG